MRASIVLGMLLFSMPVLAAPVMAPAYLPTTPDKLLRVGPKGSPDPGWGSGGVAVTRVHPTLVSADGAGGAYVFDQQSISAQDNRILVTHLTSTGVQDPAFGAGGGMILGAPGLSLLQGVTLDAKGRVVLLVSSKPMSASNSFLIAYRFANRALDTSFGGGGAITVAIPTPAVTSRTGPVAIGRDSSGRVVIAGTDDPTAHRNVFVVRLTDNGSIDGSFASGVALNSSKNYAFDVARVVVDGSGNTWVVANKSVAGGVIGGAESVPASSGIGVFRFDPNGLVDNKFGTAGAAMLEDQAYGALDAAVTNGGALIVGGYAMPSGGGASSLKPMLARFRDNGTLDASFGSAGKVVLAGVSGATAARVRRVSGDGGGHIVAVGSYRGAGDAPVTFVSRFDANGRPDASFGTAGTTSFNVSSGEPEIDPQGNALFRGP